MIKFIIASIKELIHQVTWPNAQELSQHVTLFFLGLLIITTLIATANIYLQKIVEYLYALF